VDPDGMGTIRIRWSSLCGECTPKVLTVLICEASVERPDTTCATEDGDDVRFASMGKDAYCNECLPVEEVG